MKVIKAILRAILIIITSILITAWVLVTPITKIAFNQKEVTKVLDNSDIYKNVGKEIKKGAIETINEALLDVPEEIRNEIDTEKIINDIEIDGLLRNVTNGVIDAVYSVSEKEVTLRDIVTKYITEFDEYILVNDIDIDQEVLDEIHSSLYDDSLDEVLDDDEINDSLKEVKENIDNVKAYANLIEGVLIISILILTAIILLLSNNKSRTGIVLLAIPTVILLLIEEAVSALIGVAKEDMGDLLYGIVTSLKDSMFKYVNINILIFALIIVGLILFKIFKKDKKIEEVKEEKEETPVEEKKEETKKVETKKKTTTKTKKDKEVSR